MTNKYKDSVSNESTECQWLESFPRLSYKLGKFESRKCCTNPNIEKYNSCSFQAQPKGIWQKIQERNWSQPTTKEKQSCNTSHELHISVFSNKEQGKPHGSIFNVISSDLFSFSLRQIHRSTILLCQTTNNPENDHWPECPKEKTVFLRFNKSAPIQTVCNHTNSLDNKSHRLFITNHLSNRTTTPQKSIFTISSPSCQQNSINSQTSNSKNIHCSQIQITNSSRKTGRQSSPCNLACQKCQNRSPQVQRLVCTTRQNRFFQQQFCAIQKGLLHTEETPDIWSLSSLHCSHHSAFNQSQKSNSKQQRNQSRSNHNQSIHFSTRRKKKIPKEENLEKD